MPTPGVMTRDHLARLIRDVPDWPTPGVVFKDITPLLADPNGLRGAVDALVGLAPPEVDVVVGMEARGFIVGAPVALALGAGFVPVRKPGKLPRATIEQAFALEYGEDALEMHMDALHSGARVMVVDDVLATGGTVEATTRLIESLGAEMVGVAVLLELAFLGGRARLAEAGITSVDAVVSVEA